MYSTPGIYGSPKRLAVLIDADNESPTVIQGILNAISRLGNVCVKRIYGDWSSQLLSGWKQPILQHSIQPIQQFAYSKGKNATDSALIIDAMDLLHSRRFDGFCIVSSDSDFTRLASRIREDGLLVYGFGQGKTLPAFQHACDAFFLTEPFRTDATVVSTIEQPATVSVSAPASAPVAAKPAVPETPAPAKAAKLPDPRVTITQVLKERGDQDGWVSGASLGQKIDPKLYGHKKLMSLLEKYPSCFEVEMRNTSVSGGLLYARNKPCIRAIQVAEKSLH